MVLEIVSNFEFRFSDLILFIDLFLLQSFRFFLTLFDLTDKKRERTLRWLPFYSCASLNDQINLR